MLHRLAKFEAAVRQAYDSRSFGRAVSLLNHFASAELSSWYFDRCKDKLYAGQEDDLRRRQCQVG